MHNKQGVRYIQGIPETSIQNFQVSSFPLAARDFRDLWINRAIRAAHLFVFLQMLSFPKNVSGYISRVSVQACFSYTDLARLFSASGKC